MERLTNGKVIDSSPNIGFSHSYSGCQFNRFAYCVQQESGHSVDWIGFWDVKPFRVGQYLSVRIPTDTRIHDLLPTGPLPRS